MRWINTQDSRVQISKITVLVLSKALFKTSLMSWYLFKKNVKSNCWLQRTLRILCVITRTVNTDFIISGNFVYLNCLWKRYPAEPTARGITRLATRKTAFNLTRQRQQWANEIKPSKTIELLNLVPRVLSLLRESTLVTAGHVSARF